MNSLWIGFFFILIGVGLIIFNLVNEGSSSDVEGGGVVMLGPLPIVFGSSERSALFAVVIGILALIFVYLFLFSRVF